MADLGPTTIFGDLTINGSIGGAVRVAYADGNAPSGDTVNVFLDTFTTGEAVTVQCSIVDGNDLDAATPRLADEDQMYVAKIGGVWYCLSLFYATV